MGMKLVLVGQDLINKTSNFARNVFIEYYGLLLQAKGAPEYMANLFLSPTAIEKLIKDGAIFKLATDNDEPIGFIEYKLEDNRVFLSKLYVRKDLRHTGIGKFMFDDCIKYAKDNNAMSIYLTVNKGNIPTIEIYKHLGFKQIDSVVTDIGGGYVMDDYIMEIEIEKKS